MEPKTPIELNEGERAELEEGQSLYEMTKTRGFTILKKRLEDLAFHSWIDPREAPDKEAFLWRELNAFHAANNARELLEWLQGQISKSEYLEKKKSGELKIKSMKI
jgi:hypothetical protein